MDTIFRPFDQIGRLVLAQLQYTLQVLRMVYLSMRSAIFGHDQGIREMGGVVLSQIYFTGFQALPLITVLALASGSVVIMQSTTNLNFFGGSAMIGNWLVAIVVRELGPLITALVVIARSGTAVASEIGNMRANREIQALESMGIDPLSFIVFPRLIGGVISVVCLAFYFVMISLLGGFLITKLVHGMPFSFYYDSLANAFAAVDFGLFLLKNLFSGMIIFVVSCYQGLSVKKGPWEVPIVTTQAVVNSIIYVVVFNMAVTTLFYLNQLSELGVI